MHNLRVTHNVRIALTRISFGQLAYGTILNYNTHIKNLFCF